MRKPQARVFAFAFTRGVDRAVLMMVLQIGHFAAEQSHQSAKDERLGEQIDAEWIVWIEHRRDRHARRDHEDHKQLQKGNEVIHDLNRRETRMHGVSNAGEGLSPCSEDGSSSDRASD